MSSFMFNRRSVDQCLADIPPSCCQWTFFFFRYNAGLLWSIIALGFLYEDRPQQHSEGSGVSPIGTQTINVSVRSQPLYPRCQPQRRWVKQLNYFICSWTRIINDLPSSEQLSPEYASVCILVEQSDIWLIERRDTVSIVSKWIKYITRKLESLRHRHTFQHCFVNRHRAVCCK